MDSPGVRINTVAQNIITGNTNTYTCFAGFFEKGEINKPYLINNTNELKHTFGRALDENYNDWYQCYNFLQYSSNLFVTRSIKDGMNSYVGYPNEEIPTLILNHDDFLFKFPNIVLLPGNLIKIMARTPGTWGNLLRVAIITVKEYLENAIVYDSMRAKDLIGQMNEGEYAIIVIRNRQVIEVFVKEFNNVHEINEESKYIYIKANLSDYKLIDGNIFLFDAENEDYDGNLPYNYNNLPLVYGDNVLQLDNGWQTAPNEAELTESYLTFESKGSYPIDIIIGNNRHNTAGINLVQTRKDCILFMSPTYDNMKSVDSIISYKNTLNESSYICLIGNYKYQYDGFTSDYRWVEMTGDIAGLKAKASYELEPWFTAAGINRGQILNATKLKLSLSKAQQNKLYQNGINSIIQSIGTYITGQKLLLTKPSAVTRVNIRSLLNTVIRNIDFLLKKYTFDFNNQYTRNDIEVNIKKVLEYVKSARGLYNYKVIVEEGTEKLIKVNVYIQPTIVAEFIRLQMTTTNDEPIIASRTSL